MEGGIRVHPRLGESAGLVQVLFAGDQRLDFGARKNELPGGEIGGHLVGFTFAFGQLGEEYGFFDGLLTGGQAFGPLGAEFGHVLLDGALDTLLVKRQQLDVPSFGEPGFGLRDGLVELTLADGLGKILRHLADSEDAGFEGAGAFEAPLVFGDGLGEFDLQRADGFEGFVNAGAVLLEGFVLVDCEEMDLAGEAVTIGVEARAMFAGFGSGAGGFLSVSEVGFELRAGTHCLFYLSERSPWGHATDPDLARRFAAAWANWPYHVETKGTIYLANA